MAVVWNKNRVFRLLVLLCVAVLASACNESSQYKAANPGTGANLNKCTEASSAGNSARLSLKNADEADSDSGDANASNKKVKTKANSEVDTDDDEKISYENYLEEFLKKRCLSCHGADQEYPDLSSWKAVKSVKDLIVDVVVKETMPPKEYEQRLNVEMIRRVKSWQQRGYPQSNTPAKKKASESSKKPDNSAVQLSNDKASSEENPACTPEVR